MKTAPIIRWSLSKKGLFSVSIILLMQLFFFAWMAKLLFESEHIAQKEAHSKAVLGQTNWLGVLMFMGELAGTGYAVTDDKDCLNVYQWSKDKVPGVLAELKNVLVDENVQEQRIERLAKTWDSIMNSVDAEIASKQLSSAERIEHLKSDEKQLKPMWQSIAGARHELFVDELTKADVNSSTAWREIQKTSLFVGVALSIILAVSTFILFSRNIVKRLEVLTDNSLRLSRGDALNPLVTGSDEITDLDETFHRMASELTEARRRLEASEHYLNSLIENLPVGLLTIDERDVIDFANPVSKQMFENDELIGATIFRFLPAVEGTSFFTNIEDPKPLEVTVNSTEANQAILELTSKSIEIASSKKHLIMLNDVTERHQLEQLKQEFLAMVSHDIRSPLSALQAINEMFRAGAYGELNDQGNKKLEQASAIIARLIGMISQLLDIEKLEAGVFELTLSQSSIASIVEASAGAVQSLAERKGIAIEITADNYELVCDRDRVIRMLVNLLDNAVKFSPRNSVIELVAADSGDSVEFSVTDNGRGIAPEKLSMVFEKFKQVERADETEKHGSGLGLAICKAITEAHGGTIGVSSLVGAGSRFWIKLPKMPVASV